jgi:hypothetical protein
MRSPGRTIAIVGGGFSGTVLAVNLLRRTAAQPTRIVLIERRAEIGRGVAYQSEGYEGYPHLLNVPAARMSAQTDEPLQFAQFAQARDPRCHAEHFCRGDSTASICRTCCSERSRRHPTRHAGAHPGAGATPFIVSTQRTLSCQPIQSATRPRRRTRTGMRRSATRQSGERRCRSPAIALTYAIPSATRALRAEAKTMLLIGSGLTMADVAIAAANLNPDVPDSRDLSSRLLPALAIRARRNASAVVGDLRSRYRPAALSARGCWRRFVRCWPTSNVAPATGAMPSTSLDRRPRTVERACRSRSVRDSCVTCALTGTCIDIACRPSSMREFAAIARSRATARACRSSAAAERRWRSHCGAVATTWIGHGVARCAPIGS